MTGGDLRFHIARKTFTEDAVRFWMAELGCAVRYVHQQGIVHRDIKPDSKVFLSPMVGWGSTPIDSLLPQTSSSMPKVMRISPILSVSPTFSAYPSPPLGRFAPPCR